MGKQKKVVTEVGERRSEFQAKFRLVNLRKIVNVALAQDGEQHKDAAKRAGVTATWWSRIVNSPQLTEHELGVIAKGIGWAIEDLIAETKK